MFPNPQDALPLPPRPNLEQYKKRSKELVKACQSGDSPAIRAWSSRWIQSLIQLTQLTNTRDLRIDRWVDQVTEFATDKLMSSTAQCSLANAQFVVARSHGFESWPKFAKHIEEVTRANSQVSNFEAAADAIVAGDTAKLEHLLREDPELIRARSAREHRATLLHYVSANGVESYRQKTPKNAPQIAEILLQAGAEVDATADVYGGGSTTLSLVATSVHPERAGVQNELMDILLRHGASLDLHNSAGNNQSLVNACLANGRGLAAEFLAARGALLDLEGAAGVGWLDQVKSFFGEDGNLKSIATQEQMERGFLWACEFGRNNVVEFLLQKGVDLNAQRNTGLPGLHWAVIGGHLETVRLLLARGASLEAKNAYDGTAVSAALWAVVNADGDVDYAAIVETLIDAGAKVEDGSLDWLARQKGGSSALKQRVSEVLARHGAKS